MRLTNITREKILGDILNHAFRERAQAQVATEAEFAYEVFEHIYADSLELLASAPDGFFAKAADFRVVFGDKFELLHFEHGFNLGQNSFRRGVKIYPLPSIWRRMPYETTQRQAVARLEPSDPLTMKYLKINADRELIYTEINEAHRAAKTALDSVATAKKLIAVWPEVSSFIAQYDARGYKKPNLPTIPVSELNTRLALPPKAKP